MAHNFTRNLKVAAAAVVMCAVVVGYGLAGSWVISSVRSNSALAADVATMRRDLSALRMAQQRAASGNGVPAGRSVTQLSASLLEGVGRVLRTGSVDGVSLSSAGDAVVEYVLGLDDLLPNGPGNAARVTPADADRLDALGADAESQLDAVVGAATDASDAAYERALIGVWLSVVFTATLLAVGVRQGVRAVKRVEQLQATRRSDGRLRALVEHAPDIVCICSPENGSVRYASPALERVLGYDVDQVSELRLRSLIHPDDIDQLITTFMALIEEPTVQAKETVRLRHAAGHWVHLEASFTNRIDDPNVDGIVANLRDVSERVELERTLAHEARHDPLTGLSNRAYFVEVVQRAISAAAADEEVSVVFIDLDGFKEINDSNGHGAGDEVLMAVAARLLTMTRHRDHVARLGGDEFAVLVVGDPPFALAERLLRSLWTPIELGEGPVTIGASVGVARGGASSDVDQLLRDADVAMYDAKAHGKNRISEFVPEMHVALLERLELRTGLDRALERGEFFLVYQPEMCLRTGRLLGFEALLRWRRPDGSMVAPLDFIPLAEATGQIVAIGRWVLGEALDQLATWHRESGRIDLGMAVNVSTRQLGVPEFVATVAGELSRTGVPAACLTLEVTETALVTDQELAGRRLAELRALGVRIAVDDYGSGHASIGYLRNFPVDIVKIDRSFVAALDEHPEEAQVLLRSITQLAEGLRLDTVAEGIEHSLQLESLQQLGCRVGQGYHLARPLAAPAATEFLARAGDAVGQGR